MIKWTVVRTTENLAKYIDMAQEEPQHIIMEDLAITLNGLTITCEKMFEDDMVITHEWDTKGEMFAGIVEAHYDWFLTNAQSLKKFEKLMEVGADE